MKLITILGPTCSGKTEITIKLAQDLILKKQTVWIVGCDSKQVYKFLDIGTAKIPGTWSADKNQGYLYQNIPHYLIDYVDPFEVLDYSVNNYLLDFCDLFLEFQPDYIILVGGTGLYAKNIYGQSSFLITKTEFQQNLKDYKHKLEQLPLLNLQQLYAELSPNLEGYRDLNESDSQNKIRIISLLVQIKGISSGWFTTKKLPIFEKQYLFQLEIDKQTLNQKIQQKVQQRFEQGFLEEVKMLLEKNINHSFLTKIGLDYRLALLYFKGFINYPKLIEKSIQENQKYAKRQLTWLKKEPLILVNGLTEILDKIESV